MWCSLHTRDAVAARQAFAILEAERQSNRPVPVKIFAQQFVERSVLALSKKTVSMHESAFKNFTRLCGNKLLSKVSPLDVEHFKVKRVGEVSPTSVNIELRCLRAAFNDAVRLKLIPENPFEGSKPVRVPHKEAKYLSEKEIDVLMKTIEDSNFRDLIRFAVFTMMRLGEITHLKWENVDLEGRLIHVRSSAEFRVKGGRPRTVPMAPWVTEYLLRKARKSEYVFSNRGGFPLIGSSVSRRFKRYIRRARLDDSIHFHSLRHSGISWLINRGVPPQFVQRIAGHSSLAVTSVYSHVQDQNLMQAMKVFGRCEPGSNFVSRN